MYIAQPFREPLGNILQQPFKVILLQAFILKKQDVYTDLLNEPFHLALLVIHTKRINGLSKLWHIYVMEYYTFIKTDDVHIIYCHMKACY